MQPVVLAATTAAHAHSETAASLRGADVPLVTFDVTRSYANNFTAGPTGGQAAAGNHGNQVRNVHA